MRRVLNRPSEYIYLLFHTKKHYCIRCLFPYKIVKNLQCILIGDCLTDLLDFNRFRANAMFIVGDHYLNNSCCTHIQLCLFVFTSLIMLYRIQ